MLDPSFDVTVEIFMLHQRYLDVDELHYTFTCLIDCNVLIKQEKKIITFLEHS